MTIEQELSKGSLASSKEKYAQWKPGGRKEKTPEQEKKEIELIENAHLDCQDKMHLALVYLDEKPAAWTETSTSHEIFFQAKREKEEGEILNRLSKEKKEMAKLLDQLNLIHDEGRKLKAETEDTYNIGYEFVVSKDQENFSYLQKAIEKGDDKEIGLALGYPKTAVENFEENPLDYKKLRESLSTEELNELQKEGIFRFTDLEFHPSKDHWREEIDVVRRHKKLIEEKFPNLYKEIIEKTKDPLTLIEKKNQLKEIRREVDKIRDNLGKPIDPAIKETVVMFKALEIPTSQSCGGHYKRKTSWAPWVEVYTEPPAKDWKKNEETQEKWRKENIKYQIKIIEFLNEFYRDRKVPIDQQLHMEKIGAFGGFRLTNQGAELINSLPKEEREKKWLDCRKEMKEFTQFLKEKYLSK